MLLFAVTESMWNRCWCMMRFVIIHWPGPCYHTNYNFKMNLNNFVQRRWRILPDRGGTRWIRASATTCTYNRMEERHSTTSIFLPLSSFWSIHCIGNCLEIELDKQYMAIPVSQQTCVISTWNCFQGEGALICVFMIIDIQSSVTILVIPFVMSSALNAIWSKRHPRSLNHFCLLSVCKSLSKFKL